ncbi:hypothetical protein VNO77_18981 [Canavalia gladiata]|uniref:Uncharacterized protein n=1 Tax=Canavalia gladiata TaxID=3824 RepID=A0AAN9QK40_CANGL
MSVLLGVLHVSPKRDFHMLRVLILSFFVEPINSKLESGDFERIVISVLLGVLHVSPKRDFHMLRVLILSFFVEPINSKLESGDFDTAQEELVTLEALVEEDNSLARSHESPEEKKLTGNLPKEVQSSKKSSLPHSLPLVCYGKIFTKIRRPQGIRLCINRLGSHIASKKAARHFAHPYFQDPLAISLKHSKPYKK